MSYIYKITNKINGKIYIGKTSRTIEARWKEHLKSYLNKDYPLYKAFRKYGIKSFSIELIEECNEENSNERERYWIEYYGSFKYGYNATLGGDGKLYCDYDLVFSLYKEEKNIKEISKITNYDTKTISNILLSKGYTREDLKARGKESLSKKVAMLDKNTGDILKVFSSLIDAEKFLQKNRSSQHIREVCKGKRKTAYGYRWKFI